MGVEVGISSRVHKLERQGLIRVEGREPRQSTIHDPHLLSLVPPEASPPAAG